MNLFATFQEMWSGIGMVWGAVSDVWFIVFPPLLFFLFKILWTLYVQGKYASTIKWVLLEIIPPKDIERSPQPMESIYSGFAGVIKSLTIAEEMCKGEFPTAFSLEIASIEGKVHFYVRTQAGFRHLVEAHFYAQYPDVEIVEVEDYTGLVPRTVPNKDWDLWGTDFSLVKEDLYPIKTYRYFEEDVTGKMIDPLAGVIETMGKLGPGQHLWFQLITTPVHESWYKTGKVTRDEFVGKIKESSPGVFLRLFQDIRDIVVNIGNGLLGREIAYAAGSGEEKKDEQPLEFRLSPGEKKILEALENNLGKQTYKIRMRFVYIARREVWNKPLGVSAFIGAIKQFADMNLNSFKPNDDTKTYAQYVFTDSRLRFRQRRLLRRFIGRDSDPQSTRFMLSSEELATVFHFPDMVVVAPSLSRVAAKRGSAPANLPVQD